jgi:hypothetical protein
MAEKARYEYFSFFLMSLALWLAVEEMDFISLLVAFLAVETQPAALAIPIAVIVLMALKGGLTRERIWKIAGAIAITGSLYFALHPGVFLQVMHPVSAIRALTGSAKDPDQSVGGFFTAYFVTRRRHLPELVIFLAALVVCWRQRDHFDSCYPLWSAAALIVFSILLGRGNVAYIVFLYPFLVLAVLQAFYREGRTLTLVAITFLYTMPQYAYLYWINRNEGWRSSDLHEVEIAIHGAENTLHKTDANTTVYGDYTLWFAHPQRFYAADGNTVTEMGNADVYLCFDQPLMKPGYVAPGGFNCADLKSRVSMVELSSLMLRNHLLHIYIRPE